MALSARTTSTVEAVDLLADSTLADGTADSTPVDAGWSDTVVVHVQLRPRRSATRRCLAALTALAARHESVAFALTGLSGDARAVRVTVGVELGPRDQIARFSPEAQAAYAFVDALFTDLYDFMPVYVGEPNEAERAAVAGVLDAVGGARTPAPRAPMPRIPTPRTPSSVVGAPVAGLRGIPVPA
ncbi:hypothetical protein [Modestobacter roseus]|uniref:Uncharacterized protein n=1 Tax=Modestobacter roseus TaxID=1181884 RepID=A0A562IKS7_9ACTN|nr:hypothetical protein [Modestobacter roseus]MQA34564.1 hypothetical protein [Modestobacter roseus]TWH71621.1 hypothetical protein JD78_00119 [Modestobacter roseus]